jgi:hypothetical protein
MRLSRMLPKVTTEDIDPLDVPWWPLSAGKRPGGLWGYVRAAWGMLRGECWPIAPSAPATGAILVVATPVWWGRLPPPVWSYVRAAAAGFPAIAVLSTQRGNHPGKLISDLEREAGQPVRAVVSLSDADRAKALDEAKLRNFARQVLHLTRNGAEQVPA